MLRTATWNVAGPGRSRDASPASISVSSILFVPLGAGPECLGNLVLALGPWMVRLADVGGRLLVTRRALGKRTWPGVWTNSCCGHPAPGEDPAEAARRRLGQELGLRPARLAPVLPDFAYRAVDPSGVVEHEVCPVFVAHLDGDPEPAPAAEPAAADEPATAIRSNLAINEH